ncbi:MAG: hypothetical protein H6671_00455 [Anaerolineaceae bacterium]|nr:hypothetical protein [Anaerolineaceae bacterium]
MSDLLSEVGKFIVELVVRVFLFILVEILWMLVEEFIGYFFGKTRWFSVLYLAIATLVGLQIIYMGEVAENPSVGLYGTVAIVVVLLLSPLIHTRLVALFKALRGQQPEIQTDKPL